MNMRAFDPPSVDETKSNHDKLKMTLGHGNEILGLTQTDDPLKELMQFQN